MAKSTPKKPSKTRSKETPKKAAPAKVVTRAKAPKANAVRTAPRGSNGRTEAKTEAKMKRTLVERPAPKPVAPPPPPAASNSNRPIKNKAGLKAKELEVFRELLLAKRRELLGDVSSMEEEALRSSSGGGTNLSNLPIHMADMGTDNYEQEFTLNLVQKDRDLLREILLSLKKIREGTYGVCEGTSKLISRARLEAQPWARYSIEHARKLEKGPIRG